MIIIDAAGKTSKVDQQALDALLKNYDRAGRQKRDEIAGDIEALVAPAVRGMLARGLGGLDLSSDETASLVTEVVRGALAMSGVTQYRRSDVDVEGLVRRMRAAGDEAGRRLRELISPALREEVLNARYLKASLEQQVVDQINRLLLLPDLGARLGQRHRDVSTSPVERAAGNAELLSQLFPEIKQVLMPQRSLLGYISSHLPELRRRLLKNKDPGVTPQMRADWARIKNIVEQLHASGHQPTPHEVYEQYRADLEQRTRPAKEWMEAQVRKLRPENAFDIRSAIDLRAAREILDEAGVNPGLWRDPGSPHYLAKRDVKPLGEQTIERLMSTPGLGAPALPSAERVLITAPVAPQQGEVPDWAPLSRLIGSREQLQSAIIDHIYGTPQHEAERAVALFLTDHPQPQPNQVEQFISRLRSDIAEDIRTIGWDTIAREIDDSIKDLLRSPDAIQEIAAELGLSSGTGYRSAEVIRRQIFARAVRYTTRIVRGTTTQTDPRPSTDASEDEVKDADADCLFLVRWLPGAYAEVQLGPGATLDDALTWALKFAEKGSPCWIPATPNRDRGIYVHTDGSIELADCPKRGIRVRHSPESPSLLLPVGK